MQAKHLFVTITILFSLLLSSLSQAQQVSIPDANLAAAIRQEIGNSITRQTLLNLTRLEARNRGITDLTGLEHAHNLRELNLGSEYNETEQRTVNSNTISDFSPIAGLPRLTVLNLSYCGLSDVSFLSGFTQLTSLQLYENSISDISPLAKLKTLTSLDIWDNSISDIAPLAELKKLTLLDLSNNNISDISALAECKQLTYLYILESSISDIAPLAELKKLYGLQLDGNTISDISPLAELTKLNWLTIRRNSISDVSPLAKLTKLTTLDLSNNNISDVSPLVKLNLPGTEWDSTGLDITGNPLSYASINTHIPAMQARGIEIAFDDRVPTTLVKVSGIAQQGGVNTALPLPFVVEVLDEQQSPFAGVPVTFTVATGGGELSATTVPTDADGRSAAHLTLGRTAGTTTVGVTAADISQPVQFTATAILRSAPVMIPDANLRMKIMETLRETLDEAPTLSDMLTLTTLTANDANIYDLTGLQHAANLTTLSLNNNYITEGAPLAALTQLTELSLNNNNLWDLEPLTGLTELTTLSLEYNSLSDIKPLTVLPQLKTLHLRGNWLDNSAFDRHIPAMQMKGIDIRFDPRTKDPRSVVRIIYFYPSDREPLPDIDERIDRSIKDAQQFYADQMKAHGFDRKTFLFETDTQGRAVIHHVKGRFSHRDYQNDWGAAWQEATKRFDRPDSFLFTVLDVDLEGITPCGRGGGNGRTGGGFVTARECFDVSTIAHELGHAFGLHHDSTRTDGKWIPSKYSSDRMMTSFCAAEWLDVIPIFNTGAAPINHNTTIKILPPNLASPPNVMRLSFEVNDLDGIQQVQFFTKERSGWAGLGPEYPNESTELADYKGLKGKPDYTGEFFTTQVKQKNKVVIFRSIDVHGNMTWQELPVDITSLLPPSKVVQVPDPNLATAIRQEIGNAITTHTLLNLTQLDARNREIKNLTGLEHAHNLRELDLGGEYIEGEWQTVNSNTISDFSPIAGLTRLTSLNLSDFGLSDVSFLSGFTQLTELYLNDNIISDISPLAKLTQLTDLTLRDNAISDISPLSKLTQLTDLRIGRNIVSDISSLAELKNLTYLSLYGNTISDISSLTELKNLTYLSLYGNTISDISALAELTQLTDLDLSDNAISDISALAELTQLTQLRIGSNIVSDISALANLTQLTDLYLNINTISDLSPLAELKKLTDLSLNGNTISDLSSLAELTQLTRLDLSSNNISDISPLVQLNLPGTEWDSTGLDVRWNPLSDASINTHIPAMQAKGIVVKFGDNTPQTFAKNEHGPKIEGPWLWVIMPTGRNSGAGAAASGIDFLSEMSDGSVTELAVATNGATEGDPVGDSVWTLHTLSPTRSDNINDMAKAAGLGTGDIDNHVAYGSIALDAPREQHTIMHTGSDDAVKVWLNEELVHNNPVNRGARDFQDQFPVTLKKGTNILLVAVYERSGAWTGFFGFASDAEYTIPTQIALPAWDVNEDGIVDATDVLLVTAALGQKPPENPRLDVNGDGVVDGKDIALVAEHLGEGDAPAAASRLAQPLGFTVESVEQTLNILRAADDGTLTFTRGIAQLERLLALFIPERTALLHNYPNPFNPETWIPYQLAKPAEVTLRIYAVNGALVRTLVLGHQPAGVYRIRSRAAYWDGRNAHGEPVASGVYFYTLTAGDFTVTRKMLIRK